MVTVECGPCRHIAPDYRWSLASAGDRSGCPSRALAACILPCRRQVCVYERIRHHSEMTIDEFSELVENPRENA